MIPHLASIFKLLDDENELLEHEIPLLCSKFQLARNVILARDSILHSARIKLNSGKFESNPNLIEVLSPRYQEKLLFGRAAVALTKFQNIDEIICNKCSF